MVQLPNDQYMFQYYKFKLYPTPTQVMYFDECIKANDFVYNWALEIEERQYKLYKEGKVEYQFISEYGLITMFTELRSQNPWIASFPVDVGRGAIGNLMLGYNRFFNKEMDNKHPRYKTETYHSNSFHIRADRCYIDHNKVRINGLPKFEMIDLKFDTGISKDVKLYNPVVVRDSLYNFWVCFTSIILKPSILIGIPKTEPIGIDINSRSDSRIVLSNGIKYSDPDGYRKAICNINHTQEELWYYIERRKQFEFKNPGQTLPRSNNELKVLETYRKRYAHLTNITKNFYHTVIKQILMTNPAGVVIEDLNVKAMLRKHYIADDIFHACFGMFKEIMKFECNKYSIPLYKAPKDYQSSNICSRCGYIRDIQGYHKFICPNCGLEIDRDLNAAINLKQLYFGKPVFYTL